MSEQNRHRVEFKVGQAVRVVRVLEVDEDGEPMTMDADILDKQHQALREQWIGIITEEDRTVGSPYRVEFPKHWGGCWLDEREIAPLDAFDEDTYRLLRVITSAPAEGGEWSSEWVISGRLGVTHRSLFTVAMDQTEWDQRLFTLWRYGLIERKGVAGRYGRADLNRWRATDDGRILAGVAPAQPAPAERTFNVGDRVRVVRVKANQSSHNGLLAQILKQGTTGKVIGVNSTYRDPIKVEFWFRDSDDPFELRLTARELAPADVFDADAERLLATLAKYDAHIAEWTLSEQLKFNEKFLQTRLHLLREIGFVIESTSATYRWTITADGREFLRLRGILADAGTDAANGDAKSLEPAQMSDYDPLDELTDALKAVKDYLRECGIFINRRDNAFFVGSYDAGTVGVRQSIGDAYTLALRLAAAKGD